MTSFYKIYIISLRDPWKQNQNIHQDKKFLELQLTPNKPMAMEKLKLPTITYYNLKPHKFSTIHKP